MSFWRRLFRMSAADPAMDDRYFMPLLAKNTASGVAVTPETSMKVSAVYRCVNLIANAFASLPGGVFRRVDERTRRVVPEHDVQRIFWGHPNPYQTPFAFKRMLMGHLALRGNCYARIVRGREGPELWPLHPDRVSGPELLESGRLRYEYMRPDNGRKEPLIAGRDIMALTGLSSDGLRGLALSQIAEESIGLSMATENHGAKLFGKGVRLAGVLKTPGIMGQPARDALSKSFRDNYGDFGLPVLEQGMEFQSIGMSSEDAQFLETRKFEVSDIARWFGVPPHMIGDVERSTSWGTGIENQTIQFVTDCMLPWVVLWEQTIRETFIDDPAEYVKFNVNSRLRADSKTRFDIYALAIANGIYSPNDCRALEDENPREGGDTYVDPSLRGSGTAPAAVDKEPMEPADEPMEPMEPENALLMADSEDQWVKNWAREIVRVESLELAAAARTHASKPSAWRRFVASYYGRRVALLSEYCDSEAAKTYCAARREAILTHGVALLEQNHEAESALAALAARGRTS